MSKTVTLNKCFRFLEWLAQHEQKLTETQLKTLKRNGIYLFHLYFTLLVFHNLCLLMCDIIFCPPDIVVKQRRITSKLNYWMISQAFKSLSKERELEMSTRHLASDLEINFCSQSFCIGLVSRTRRCCSSGDNRRKIAVKTQMLMIRHV